MTSKKAWSFSPHARARIAKRIGLLMDMGTEAKISNILNSYEAKVVRQSHGRVIYEVPLFGVQMIAVCSVDEHVVVTFIEARKWHRKKNCRQSRCDKFRPKSELDLVGTEEE